LSGQGLVKTTRFQAPSYVGDPVNAVRVFNEKEVDELIILDIGASRKGLAPNYALLADIASEAFMPMGYGGGVSSLDHARRIFEIGFEKIVLNSAFFGNSGVVRQIVGEYGASSVVASIDVAGNMRGRYEVYEHRTGSPAPVSLKDHIAAVLACGVGELFLTAVDRDGTLAGIDLALIEEIAGSVDVPLIACGGAASLADFASAIAAGASAVAAGAMFVYYGPYRAVLIQYPEPAELDSLFGPGQC
jgi:cyclase